MINSDYEIPFNGMSEDEFLYRTMNEEDEMYMGDRDDDIEDEIVIDDIDCTSEEDEEDCEEEDEEMDEEIEDIKFTLECEWNYCDCEDTFEDKDSDECEVWNLKILSYDGKNYSVSFDLQPYSNDENMRLPLTATLTKDDDMLIVTNLDELKKIKKGLL